MPAASSADRSSCSEEGSQTSNHMSPSSRRSSAPASSTIAIRSSSETVRGTVTTPFRSNCHDTAPGSAIEPPLWENAARISAPVRLRLSVRHSTITATPEGAGHVGDRLIPNESSELAGAALDRPFRWCPSVPRSPVPFWYMVRKGRIFGAEVANCPRGQRLRPVE